MERLTFKCGDGLYEAVNPIDIYDNEYSKSNYKEIVKRLGEYEDLQEQGELLRLPCAEGDRIYTIRTYEDTYFVDDSVVEEVSTQRIWIDSMYFDHTDIGKTVFLTKEGAAAALRGMNGEEEA